MLHFYFCNFKTSFRTMATEVNFDAQRSDPDAAKSNTRHLYAIQLSNTSDHTIDFEVITTFFIIHYFSQISNFKIPSTGCSLSTQDSLQRARRKSENLKNLPDMYCSSKRKRRLLAVQVAALYQHFGIAEKLKAFW